MQSSDEWPRNYRENISSLQELTSDHEPSAGDNVLSPRGSIGKQIRRRSRASKKAPMTLLNANTGNFRALVQQFTGCHTTTPGNYKGPINLNFAQYSYSSLSEKHEGHRKQLDNDESDQSLFSFGTNNIGVVTTAAAANTVTTSAAAADHDYDHDHDHELFASKVDYNSTRSDDPLSLDGFDINSLSIQEMSGPGDYPGTSHDDFWGY